MMNYKGYTGKVVSSAERTKVSEGSSPVYDDEAGCFYGEILGLRDVVTFKGTSVKELQKSFKESIDDYLAFCARMKKEPDIPASGRLVLRLAPEVHSHAIITAKTRGMSLNSWVVEAVKEKLMV